MVTKDRKSRYLKTNIQNVRMMLSSHPYNLWPLHVKFFTHEANKVWNQELGDLPTGLTCVTELEGVDGKSGLVGSGRVGPVDVTDGATTSRILAKHTSLPTHRCCTICKDPFTESEQSSLSTSICPNSTCTASFHLLCLSTRFLAEGAPSTALLPRGGTCPSCGSYTLWGDVVKASYRRHAGSGMIEEEEEELLEPGEIFGAGESDSNEEVPPEAPTPRSPRKAPALTNRKRGRPPGSKNKSKDATNNSDSREEFDFGKVVVMKSSSDEDEQVRNAVGRSPPKKPRKVLVPSGSEPPKKSAVGATKRATKAGVTSKTGAMSKTSTAKLKPRAPTSQLALNADSAGEQFDFTEADAVPSTDSEREGPAPPPRRKPKSVAPGPAMRPRTPPRRKPKSAAAAYSTMAGAEGSTMGTAVGLTTVGAAYTTAGATYTTVQREALAVKSVQNEVIELDSSGYEEDELELDLAAVLKRRR